MSTRARRFPVFDEGFLGMTPALFFATLVVGVGGACVGAAYLLVFHWLQHALWPDNWSDAGELLVLPAIGVAVAVIAHTLGSPGNVELLVDNIHVSGAAPDVRALRSLVPMSLLTISAGGAAGPEAPLVTTCGSLAGLVARRRAMTASDARCLTIAGMAAAFTVLFGTPIGSALFALEILHRRGMEYHEALLPSIVGALSGYGVFVLLTRNGLEPIWHIPGSQTIRGVDLLWALAAGVGGAVIAVVYTALTLVTRRIFVVVPAAGRPVVGGVALAALAFWTPYALTFGEAQTTHVLAVQLSVGVLVAALVAKLIASTVTLASGWPGGFIIPLFFVGAAGGQLAHHAFSDASTVVMCSALMAAGLVGVTKTLLGSTLVVTAMTGLRLLPTVLLAAVVSMLLTSGVRLIHTQRERSDPTADVE